MSYTSSARAKQWTEHRAQITTVCAIILMGGTSCASFSTHLTPRPTEEGRVEVAGNIDLLTFQEDNGTRSLGPAPELTARYGISRFVDIGAKLHGLGLEANSRVLLLGSDSLDISLVPGAGVLLSEVTSGHTQAGVLSFALASIAGVRLNPESMIVLGPKCYVHVATHDATTKDTRTKVTTLDRAETVIYPGATLGFHYQFNEALALFPEINLLSPYLTLEHKFARPVYQGGIAFQLTVGR
jgi:hypothetical protein